MLLNHLSISFSGVDGAGKTTVLRLVKESLLSRGYKVTELRSRPSILPILSSFKYGKAQAEHATSQKLPRQGKNKSTIGSYLRFGYYLTDYLIGQVYIYIKYTRRGYFILYDRFYYDYIVDPKRANLKIHERVTRFFLHFIAEPSLNFFLYAPEEIIINRKKELDSETIRFLTKRYISLFSDLGINSEITYICIKNIELVDTLREIESHLNGMTT